MSTLRNRLVGLAASLALLLLVVGIPTVLVAINAIPSSTGFSLDRLTSPDDGTVAVAVIAGLAWLAWLVFATSVAVELLARLRGIHAPQLPGLAVPQLTAGRLIALAALLFAAVPAVAQTLQPAPAAAATLLVDPPSAQPNTEQTAAAQTAAAVPPGSTPVRASADQTPTSPYTVKRGDSLWRIADRQLGDGRRYHEIVDLNPAVLHGQPDFITPGTVLHIPSPPASDDDATYVVRPGDTLSEIAEQRLGDPEAYHRIFEASRDTVQPDGDRLTDPDLIRPGWRLTLPTDNRTAVPATAPAGSAAPPKAGRSPDDPMPPGAGHPHPPSWPAESAPPATASGSGTADTPAAGSESADNGSTTPGWVLPGLSGAGAVVAGSLLLVLRQHRRIQQRYRRPGRIIAPPPPELRPVEKSADQVGTITAPRIDLLDRALRHLPTPAGQPPRLHWVELSDAQATLHLAQPAELPQPWQGEHQTWALTLDSEPPQAVGTVAPYPLLVSVGQDDRGALVLVNLEELGSIAISGPPEPSTAVARHLAAELALNPWSTLVEIDTVGIGAELAGIDPLRVRHHPADDTAFLDRLGSELDAEPTTPDPDRFRALLATTRVGESAVSRIAKIITSRAGRPGAAVVTVGKAPGPDDAELRVTADGRLEATDIGTNLIAAGLTGDEAAACAAIVDLTRDAPAAPPPVTETGTHPPEPLQDSSGALRSAVTEPRPTGPDSGVPGAGAGDRSLLPLDTRTYEEKAATTAQDIDTLAPVVPASVEQQIAENDPDLDGDLAAWSDPDSPLPRLRLLGPVDAHAAGEAKAVARRKPFYVELLAYLALHPHGVTTPEVCDAFGLTPSRARGDLTFVRRWLGTNPATGQLFLPSARARQTDDRRGLPLYELDGVLTDLDLFRRLRTRGQSRGAAGIEDLVAALRLVSGEPFTGLRPAGWNWLLDRERIDHVMTCAIVDVAHIVTTHALVSEDFDLARFAAETACRAAPDDEIGQLDLIQVAVATGHVDLAERHLVDAIFNRTDDDLGPVEVPERTLGIVRRRGWAHAQPPRPS